MLASPMALNSTTSTLPFPIDELVPVLGSIKTVSFLNVVSASLMIFDYLLTLQREIDYVWMRPFSYVSVLFMLVRYMPFFDLSMTLLQTFVPHPSSHFCITVYRLEGYSFGLGFIFSDAILTIRTIAIWGNGKKIVILCICMLVVMLPPMLYLGNNFFASLRFSENPFPTNIDPGCLVTDGNNAIFAGFIVLLFYETIIFLLTVGKIFSLRRDAPVAKLPNSLYTVIFRDGLSFYAYLLATSIINIALIQANNNFKVSFVLALHRTLHAILAERLLLNIRAADAHVGTPPNLPSIRTAPSLRLEFAVREAQGPADDIDDEIVSPGVAGSPGLRMAYLRSKVEE